MVNIFGILNDYISKTKKIGKLIVHVIQDIARYFGQKKKKTVCKL